MKIAALTIALLVSGAAVAQTSTTSDTSTQDSAYGTTSESTMETPASVENPYTTTSEAALNESAQTTTSWDQTSATGQTTLAMAPASPAVIQPSNQNPEHDARGIAVISDPALVPDGWNGVSGTAMGGPLLDPVSGEAVDADDASYPACSSSVTDNCLQAYERGRSS